MYPCARGHCPSVESCEVDVHFDSFSDLDFRTFAGIAQGVLVLFLRSLMNAEAAACKKEASGAQRHASKGCWWEDQY